VNYNLPNTPIQNKLLDIIHSFKSRFIVSSHVSLDRPLSLLVFSGGLEYHSISMPQKVSIGYDKIIANDVGLASLELVLP
jgi:hypothetical protein